jgi:hypothetical protein
MRERIWFDPPVFRWSRVFIVATFGIAAVLAWLAHERGMWGVPALGPGIVVLTPAASGVPPRAAVPAMPVMPSAAPLASLAAASAAAPGSTARPAARVPAADEVEICGRGTVKVRPGASEAELGEQARTMMETPLRDRWLAAMLARGDARTRAAALVLSNRTFDDDAAAEQLVRLALDSRDATVYGWALYVCHGRNDRRASNACLMLSHDDWAALAPNQAIPWLYVASDEAKPRRIDPTEAMYRAARADGVGSSWGVLPGLVLATQPPGAEPIDRYVMLMEAIATSAAINSRTPYPTRYCATALLGDANRREQCERLAQLFVNKADTVLDLTVGKGLGARLGWPAERVKAISDEASALQTLSGGVVQGDQPMSCASIERTVAHFGDVARLGEIGAAREAARRAGRTVQALAASIERDAAAAGARVMPIASAPGS